MVITLYHGSNVAIDEIDLSMGLRDKVPAGHTYKKSCVEGDGRVWLFHNRGDGRSLQLPTIRKSIGFGNRPLLPECWL